MKGLICNQKKRRVCCKIETPPTSDSTTLRTTTDPNSPIYIPSAKKGDCGLSGNSEFIVGKLFASISFCYMYSNLLGGEDTDLGEFPWMVQLRRVRPSNRIWWHCGGTLINKWFVVSAAHCGQVDQVKTIFKLLNFYFYTHTIYRFVLENGKLWIQTVLIDTIVFIMIAKLKVNVKGQSEGATTLVDFKMQRKIASLPH